MDITTTRKVQIDIEALTPQGLFRDALYFEEDAVPSDIEVAAIAQERAENWLNVINTPPVEVEPEPVPEPEYLVVTEDGTEVFA